MLANCAKQRRFQERHPHYLKEKCERAKRAALLTPQFSNHRGRRSTWRTYELFDPRDPERLPLIVGCASTLISPVWANLWRVRELSDTAWAAWLRELEAVGLEPAERSGWAIGSVVPISLKLGEELVRMRVKQIQQAGGSWLLRRGGP